MSSSSAMPTTTTRPTYPVQVTAGPDDVITIWNGSGQELAREVHTLRIELPRGLYSVRTEFASRTRDEDIRVDRPIDLLLPVGAYSAAPLTDTVTAHEYYTGPAVNFSRISTRPDVPPDGTATARIMLFFRAFSRDTNVDLAYADRLSLRDVHGNEVCSFKPGSAERDPQTGWVALSVKLRPGLYRLHYDGKTPREIALRARNEWDIFWFVMVDEGEPRFDAMSAVLAAPGNGFHPADRAARAIDLGLWSLQNGVTAFPRDEMQALLTGKFDNPLSGVIGVHLLLRRTKLEPDEVKVPIECLRTLLGETPDVVALEIAASHRFPSLWPNRPFAPQHDPPILRAGLQILYECCIDHPDLIAEGSLLERIAACRYGDSPWTTWDPRGLAVVAETPEDPLDWIDYTIADVLESANKRNQIGELELGEVARAANVPQRVASKRISKLRSTTSLASIDTSGGDTASLQDALSKTRL